MTRKQKPGTSSIGMVLKPIKDPSTLKPWADYLAGIDPWKSLEIASDALLTRWTTDPGLRFFTAAEPKAAKLPDFGFDHQDGLIVFTPDSRKEFIEGLLKTTIPDGFGDGGYVALVGTTLRHKGVGKYLLSAAERVIAEKHKRVFLFVSEINQAAQKFYKGLGYEEVGKAIDALKPGNNEILLTKVLEI
jgi:GNAT superfamily N-acetyltransferase